MSNLPRIGIVLSTTRPTRFADTPANWLMEIAGKRHDAQFEIVDLRDYPMPFFEDARSPAYGPSENEVARRWAARMAELDGYVFVTAEYNHSITGVLKNALDYLASEVHRKPAAFLAYGSSGGSRAVQHLKHILTELQVAPVRHAVHIGMIEMIGMLREGKSMADYPYLVPTAEAMLDEIVWWSRTLRDGRVATAQAAAA